MQWVGAMCTATSSAGSSHQHKGAAGAVRCPVMGDGTAGSSRNASEQQRCTTNSTTAFYLCMRQWWECKYGCGRLLLRTPPRSGPPPGWRRPVISRTEGWQVLWLFPNHPSVGSLPIHTPTGARRAGRLTKGMSAHDEHDPDSDAESEDACEWLLGFVEPPRRRTDLLRHRFPSKVGGRPAWLDPLHLPTEEQLTCRVTGKPLDYLLQVRRRCHLPPPAAACRPLCCSHVCVGVTYLGRGCYSCPYATASTSGVGCGGGADAASNSALLPPTAAARVACRCRLPVASRAGVCTGGGQSLCLPPHPLPLHLTRGRQADAGRQR